MTRKKGSPLVGWSRKQTLKGAALVFAAWLGRATHDRHPDAGAIPAVSRNR